jgi:predicted transcriptional regulator of viral defense system
MYIKPEKGEYLEVLLRSKNTVFTVKDVSLLWREADLKVIIDRLNKYSKSKKLLHPRRGVYAKDKDYDKYELATKILRPSYVSFETVLGASGITFQYYSQIFVASYVKREIECGDQKYSFKKIKDTVLNNPTGIDQSGTYAIATKERAFLDTLYIYKKYYFDNLSPLDWDKVFNILPIYQNKVMEKVVHKLYKIYKPNI